MEGSTPTTNVDVLPLHRLCLQGRNLQGGSDGVWAVPTPCARTAKRRGPCRAAACRFPEQAFLQPRSWACVRCSPHPCSGWEAQDFGAVETESPPVTGAEKIFVATDARAHLSGCHLEFLRTGVSFYFSPLFLFINTVFFLCFV